jgi:hypothetical protein
MNKRVKASDVDATGSLPIARGGLRGFAFIRFLKSAIRRFATATSGGGTDPVFFSNACKRIIRFPKR